MSKRIFIKNPNILKEFLITVLNLELDPKNTSITIISNELIKSKRQEYHKTVDILVKINNNLKIDVELNSEKFKTIKLRNTLYLHKISTDTIEVGTATIDMSKYYFYQLNLNSNNSDNTSSESYMLLEENSHKPLLDNFKIICKSLDYYKKLYYNSSKYVSKDVIWLALLRADNFSELKEMSKLVMNDKDSKKFVNDCIEASQDEVILSEWEADKMAKLVKDKTLEDAYNEGEEDGYSSGYSSGKVDGYNSGKADGYSSGKEDGYNSSKEETIKSMLEEGMPYELISKVTKKGIQDIKRIEQSMKD